MQQSIEAFIWVKPSDRENDVSVGDKIEENDGGDGDDVGGVEDFDNDDEDNDGDDEKLIIVTLERVAVWFCWCL